MAGDKDNLDMTTQLVHAGERTGSPSGQPTSTPIYASATFTYESMAEIDQVFEGTARGSLDRSKRCTLVSNETTQRAVEVKIGSVDELHVRTAIA